MNWVNKRKLLAIETVKYNGQPCLEINDLWIFRVKVREREICQSQAYDSPLLFAMHNNNQRSSVLFLTG